MNIFEQLWFVKVQAKSCLAWPYFSCISIYKFR